LPSRPIASGVLFVVYCDAGHRRAPPYKVDLR
jgi:hypothetical protein